MKEALLPPDVKRRLLESIDADRLVVLCGAGLSMAPPSNLPSARRVAEICFDAYSARIDQKLDDTLRYDIGGLAEHFAMKNDIAYFIEKLVPWCEFVGSPNSGHAAIADLLITRAAVAGLTSNYDELIERKACEYGADFRGSLDGDEAMKCTSSQSPLLKFHGCSRIDRGSTVWTISQLEDKIICDRMRRSKIWMEANLRQKDLLIVGFWSDWDYLNRVIGRAIQKIEPTTITIIDPCKCSYLKQKAPDLWNLVHQSNIRFFHGKMSGADALDELRRAFSENYLRQVLYEGRETFKDVTGADCDQDLLNIDVSLSSESLYDWRRDVEGVPINRPAKKKRPDNVSMLGCFHLLLRRAGAVQKSEGYMLNEVIIRIINGTDNTLSKVRKKFIEAPAASLVDIFVAVNVTDLGLPENVVRSGDPGSIVRPAAKGRWLTFQEAREELNAHGYLKAI